MIPSHRFVPAGLFLVGLVLAVASGCSKGASTETAASTPADPVTLLDAGQEPRSKLRYRIAEGTTTTSTSTIHVTTLASSREGEALTVLPGVRLDVVSGPATTTKKGARFEVDVVNATPVIPPGFDEALAEGLRAGAGILEDIGARVVMNDRGVLVEGELHEKTKRADIPARLLRMIINVRATVTRVRLPVEPVGLGARWETKRTIDIYGFKVTQIDTYQLVDRAGEELMLNLTVQQLAQPQKVTFPEEGMEIAVESFNADATGQLILDLEALESDASVTGTSVDRISVRTVEGTEQLEIDEKFELEVANTTHLAPLEPVGGSKKSRAY